jgi:hypothetical protein
MMGSRAFILFKDAYGRQKSAKQAEIRLAPLLKILWIGRAQAGRTAGACPGCNAGSFPADMANSFKIAGSVI